MMKGDVRNVLSTLEERERDVVVLRFGLDGGQPRTLEQIGKQFGLSRGGSPRSDGERMPKSATRQAAAPCAATSPEQRPLRPPPVKEPGLPPLPKLRAGTGAGPGRGP